MTHADLDPAEGIGLKRFQNGSNATMPTCTASDAGFNGIERQVKVVAHQYALFGVERQASCLSLQTGACVIHG